jgi:hypothetical protein
MSIGAEQTFKPRRLSRWVRSSQTKPVLCWAPCSEAGTCFGRFWLGVAQPLIDFLFWIHFIKPIYVIEPFAFGRAAILVLVTAAIGYVTGIAFAMLWNRVQR